MRTAPPVQDEAAMEPDGRSTTGIHHQNHGTLRAYHPGADGTVGIYLSEVTDPSGQMM